MKMDVANIILSVVATCKQHDFIFLIKKYTLYNVMYPTLNPIAFSQ